MRDAPGARPPTASDDRPDLRVAERAIRGLSPDAKPFARHLLDHVFGPDAGDGSGAVLPRAGSPEVIGQAVLAVREAIARSGEEGMPHRRLRVLHRRLDREFVRLVQATLDRNLGDARALLRDVSHDLRSPLNSIVFLAEALSTGHSGPMTDVQRRQVGVLYQAALSLTGLLNDLIDAARLDETFEIQVSEEPFSLEEVLRQVDGLLGPSAAQGGVELAFRLETLGPRRGDRRIVTRVLLNLVANAIQASPRGGRVEVRAHEERAAWLTVTVADQGEDPDLDRIRRVLAEAPLPDPGSRDRGWTHGLGLSICARLATAAGGRIEVASAGDRGASFRLELPFGRA